ncbi:MAG: ABC transporter ATP-binding protein/permease [Clostridioides sp.]|jgi:ATP-binding cassette subfamily B protein|nr:ABC transporter ATP-binding protein/permease [Clostridioides sp.]
MKQSKSNIKIDGKTVKRLLSYITGKYRVLLVAVFICIITSAVAGVIGSMFIQKLIDDYIAPLLLMDVPVFTGLIHALLIMALIYAIGVSTTLLYNWLMVVVAQGTLKSIRDDMFSHMQSLPIKYFDTHTFGDIMSRYTNDTDTLRQMIAMSLPQSLSSLVTIFAVTFAMFAINIWMTFLVFITVGLMLYIVKTIGGKSVKFFVRQQETLGDLDGFIEEMINGQKVVKVFCHEEQSKSDFDEKNDKLRQETTSANTFANIIGPIVGNVGNLQYVFIGAIGGALAIGGIGGVTLGSIASFLMLSKSFSQPIGQISQQLNAVIMALAGAGRIFELIDEKPEEDDGYVTLVNACRKEGELTECPEHTGIWAWKVPGKDGSITYTELNGDVRLYDVDFGYDENKLVLNNISLYAKPGQKIAFVGATGAGKTTITNLINRFYDIDRGEILFDGIDIKNIQKNALRRSLGVILQETNLFTGTVMDNIRYGRLDASDEDIVNAAKLANAHDFITRLPDGYQTVIEGDGGSLSQGQRQLLSIARAAVADPPVMIMDEATSSIDTRTETLVQKGMDGLMRGRTVFVIAHRLSTVQNSKAIMVLEHGQIIERGDHDALIAEKGKYYQLYTGAFAE